MPTVELRVVGSTASLSALRNVLGLERPGKAKLVWSSASSFAPQHVLGLLPLATVKIHCWIDLADPGTARLYFVAPMHDRFMMRELELNHRFGSFELESLAQIIELSVDVLLTDAAAGMSRKEAQAILANSAASSSPEPKPPPAEYAHTIANPGIRLHAAARYGVTRYSSEVPLQHGPGVSVALERDVRSVLQQLAVAVTYAVPVRMQNETASATLTRTNVALELSQLWVLGKTHRHFWGPKFETGFAWVGATPAAGTRPGVYTLSSETRRLEAYVGPGLVYRIDLSRHFSAALSLTLNLFPRPVRHEFIVDGVHEELTVGQRFRPALSLALIVR